MSLTQNNEHITLFCHQIIFSRVKIVCWELTDVTEVLRVWCWIVGEELTAGPRHHHCRRHSALATFQPIRAQHLLQKPIRDEERVTLSPLLGPHNQVEQRTKTHFSIRPRDGSELRWTKKSELSFKIINKEEIVCFPASCPGCFLERLYCNTWLLKCRIYLKASRTFACLMFAIKIFQSKESDVTNQLLTGIHFFILGNYEPKQDLVSFLSKHSKSHFS